LLCNCCVAARGEGLGREVTRLLGKAIGLGLEDDIRDATAFLMNHFEDGDRVYLFGFNRGARVSM
jgi:uncharacterized protein (DUF2235 family)